MLIIEGPDHCGKTTAVKRLVELSAQRAKYPTYVQHFSCPNPAFNWFGDYKDVISPYAIIDRFHLSGIAYQKAVPHNVLRLIEGWLGCMSSYTVLFAADMDWYEKWIKKSKKRQMFSTELNIQAAERYYLMGQMSYDFPIHIDQTIWVNSGWPDDTVLETILDCWYNLLEVLER